MKLLFYLALWKRPEITEICFIGLKRLCNKFNGEILAVISQDEMIPLCEKYGVMWVMHNNLPIGRKKNFGLRESLRLDWDYVVELGSDDIIKDELIEMYLPEMQMDTPVLYCGSVSFINSETLACRYIKSGSPFGLGRAIKRSVIEEDHEIYPAINNGLDKMVLFTMAKRGILGKIVKTERPLTIDIKSDVNIWKYSSSLGQKIGLTEVLEGLSSEEVEAIKSLAGVTV